MVESPSCRIRLKTNHKKKKKKKNFFSRIYNTVSKSFRSRFRIPRAFCHPRNTPSHPPSLALYNHFSPPQTQSGQDKRAKLNFFRRACANSHISIFAQTTPAPNFSYDFSMYMTVSAHPALAERTWLTRRQHSLTSKFSSSSPRAAREAQMSRIGGKTIKVYWRASDSPA